MSVDNDMLILENQMTTVEIESFETERTLKQLETKKLKAKNNIKPVKPISHIAKPITIKATDADVADGNNPLKRNELEKPLDLSVPFKNSENTDLKIEQKSAAQSRVTNIFATETKKKPRSLEIDGDFLMSPEPEAEKLKSVDGAGIVIKFKR